ncbi:hypothetical protein ENH_00027720 [Eimeria necatrix]|uniref:Uncharacterized protein n=1 Tax=Eimeria necatrix TaxID=51315 RepID=U6MV30_9EIME|nr:hypothetical protein ENH_00027720 [Eimeria necatrix]CDJ66958.1 hypothetical protein ENH_00027720 [Eimeria necatrix]
MSVSKMPSGTAAHHPHAPTKPTVAERPHGHKEAPQQVVSITNVMPGDTLYVTWEQFHSAMTVIRIITGGSEESGAMSPILSEYGINVQAFLLRIERRYTQIGLEPHDWGSAVIDQLMGPAPTY